MKQGNPRWIALFVVAWIAFCVFALTVNGVLL
jgi:hypothetical protein